MLFNKSLIKDLNDNQKKLMKYLEKNSKNILSLSINEVAKNNNVTSSFVTKTLKKLSYSGWKDFRAFILMKLIVPGIEVGYLKYLQKTLFLSIEASISKIDEFIINDLVQKIQKCRGVVFFIGEGFSYFLASDQARRYKKSGIKSMAINSNDYEIQTVNINDLVFLISASRFTESIQNTIKDLEKRKVENFLITMNPNGKRKEENVICGIVRDSESLNEREFPKHSRVIMLIILDWIFTKFQKKQSSKKISKNN